LGKKEQIGVLMIDFVKAFDSIEHEFISKALKFFGFGDHLIRMVGTLLTERRSCIDLNSSHGKYFAIARGAPQGDRSSPYIFIICIELLILKLEVDDSGFIEYRRRTGVFQNRYLDVNQLVEAFADDLTAIFKWSLNALGRIITILNEFGNISGLIINKSKTSIMICGKEWEGGDSVLGIKIVSTCKLLGILIVNKSSDLNRNWIECLRKIWGLIHYWTNFRLSITGRVMVAKTFLISQATFYMGIIPADKKKLSEMEQAINGYVCGGLKIAQDRINNRVEQGGLGLIKLEELDTAIKCGWINRWLKDGVKRDITGSSVFELGHGNPETIDAKLLGRSKLPCMSSITAAWSLFRKKYYENESNIYEARIFANPGILSTVGQKIEATVFIGRRVPDLREHLKGIRLVTLLNERGEIKDKREIEAIIPNFSRTEFLRLWTEVNFIIRKYKPRIEMLASAKNIVDFLTGIKMGSNKFRSKMSGRGSPSYAKFDSATIKPVNTLWEQLGLEKDEKLISIGFTLWKLQFLDIGFREFLFKMAQGMVHGNTVISHFGNVDRKCTFCKIIKIKELSRILGRDPDPVEILASIENVADESRPHIFWDCKTVNDTIRLVQQTVWGVNILVKKDFLMGKLANSMEASALYLLINMFVRYKIWNYKLAGILPKSGTIIHETKEIITGICNKPSWRGQLPPVRQLHTGIA
jgi:hypothetical protein